MIRRCWWGLRWHPAETAVRFGGGYPKPACYRHRANVELLKINQRQIIRDFDRAMDGVLRIIATPAERIEVWARQIRELV